MQLSTWKSSWSVNESDRFRKSRVREIGRKNYRIWCKIQLQFGSDDRWVYDCRITDLSGRLVVGTSEVGPFKSAAAAKVASYHRVMPLLNSMVCFETRSMPGDAESAEKDYSRVLEDMNDEIPF